MQKSITRPNFSSTRKRLARGLSGISFQVPLYHPREKKRKEKKGKERRGKEKKEKEKERKREEKKRKEKKRKGKKRGKSHPSPIPPMYVCVHARVYAA
jgi:hypothetical protein